MIEIEETLKGDGNVMAASLRKTKPIETNKTPTGDGNP